MGYLSAGIASYAHAAPITAAEYFIDTDPGEGFGVTIPVPVDGLYDSTVEQVEFAVDTVTLKVGRHTVYVRMKNVDGVWGVARPISNDLELAAPYNLTVEGTKTITAAEYFIGADLNADPGPGNGIQINLPADGLFNSGLEDLEIPIDTTGLEAGLHTVYVRAQDNNGDWGVLRQYTFEVSAANVILGGKVGIDIDPIIDGTGANAMTSVDGAFDEGDETGTLTLNTAGFASGGHRLYVRMRDKTGYGPVVVHSLGVSVPAVQITSQPVQTPVSGGNIPFTALVEDHAGGEYRIKVEYSTDGINWKKATLSGAMVDNTQALQVGPVATSGGAVSLGLTWQSAVDFTGQEHIAVVLRLTLDNGAGSTADTTSANFSLDNLAPRIPALIAPSDGFETKDPTPLFVWQAVELSARYHLQVDNQADFSSPEIDESSLSGSYFISAVPLTPGRYFWRVSAKDLMGNGSAFSAVSDFLLQSDTTPPVVTTLTYSSNPATVGAALITATFSEPVTTVPTIAIDQPGTVDLALTSMGGSGSVWTYVYQVHKANGTEYVDGTATVCINGGKDAAGNEHQQTCDTFIINTSQASGTIVAAEYFIDADPGEGVAIPIPAMDGAYESAKEQVEFAIDTSTLKIGRHTVYVRMKNADGVWGVARPIPNDLELAAPYNLTVEGTKTITAAEYFVGADLSADPGPGNGNKISLPGDGLFDSGLEGLELPLDTTGLDAGLHTVYVRAQDSNGDWGVLRQYTFEVSAPNRINAAEYFVDVDPGTGKGVSVLTTDGGFDEGIEEVSGSLDAGILSAGGHTLYLRMRDATGWGPSVSWNLGVSVPAVQITTQPFQTPGSGGNIPFTVLAEDHAGGDYRLKVEYSTDGANWKKATLSGAMVDNSQVFQVGPIATASSVSFPLTWQSSVDLANQEHAHLALRLIMDNGAGRFAETLSSNFTIDNLAPLVPVLITPANASKTTDPTPLFVWQNVAQGVTYHLQADNQADFSSPEVSEDTANNFFIPALSFNPGHYFWRVRATDVMGNVSAYSGIADFLLQSDFVGSAVSLSYSANPAGAGSLAIVAMFSEPVVTTPKIAIDQPGTEDLTTTGMTGSGQVWVYLYEVHRADGSTYIDGVAKVTIINGKDAAGNDNQTATNDTFVINTGQPSGTIIAAEYFVDTDPGEGLGVPIPSPGDGAYNGSKEQVEFTIDTGILKIGRHTVYVRMKNADGVWGVARPIPNDLELAAPYNLTVEGDKVISAAEYFIDTDPGAGNGVLVSVPADGVFDNPKEGMELSLNTAGITEGLHTVYLRARDNNGDWGPTNQYTFEVRKSSGIIIDGGEYFIDTDPGEGNGSPLNPVDGTLDEMVEQMHGLHDTTGLTEDAHQVFVRARSSGGTWSQVVSQPLMVGQYPYITGISPAYGQSGSLVSVSGLNFGNSQGSSSITFNGVTAIPTGWTDTEIIVPVPYGATSGAVIVTVDGNPSNADHLFSVIYPPVITGLSPDIGMVGSNVTITGSNFGTNSGAGLVTFNGVTASVITWGNNNIVAIVPTGATTGAVIVTVRGLESNADHIFTLLSPDGDEDGDGLSNADEIARGTDPRNHDTDGDGMPDGWEVTNGLNPLFNDAGLDPDGDGLTNLQEYSRGTKPTVCDTDGDSVCDGDDFDPIVPGVITLNPDEPLITVAVGGTRTFHVKVQNLQSFPDWVSLSLEGLDPSWYTLSQDNVFLLPGQKRSVAIHVVIPEDCSLTAASYSFTLRGISTLGGKEAIATASLLIDPDPEVRPLFSTGNESVGNNSITIAWRTNVSTTTEVNYKKSSDASFTQAMGTPGLEHEVTLADLQWGETYQWYTVSRSVCGETQTALQQGTISRGVVFDLRGTEVYVDRDYNQPVSMTITNMDSLPHTATVRLINPYSDIVAGFVGAGSETAPMELTPGQTTTTQLYVHAQDAESTRYVLYADVTADPYNAAPIHDRVPVIVNVRPYVFNVQLQEVDRSIASLTNSYQVINYGDTVTDLRVYVEEPTGSKVFLNPAVNHGRLENSGFIEFKLTGSEPLSGVLVAETSSGSVRLPFQLGCLPGQTLREVTIANPTIEAQVGDWYCTNKQDFEIPFYLPSGYTRENIQQVYMKATFMPLHPVMDIAPHDVMLYVNGELVWTLFDDVPDGEYTIDIPATLLHIASEGTGSNYLRIRAEGINEGAYLATTDFKIGVVLDQMSIMVCGTEPPPVCTDCPPPPPPCPYVSNVEVSRDGELNRVNGQYQYNFRPGQTVDILATVKNPLRTPQQVTATIHLISDVGGEVIVDQPVKTILLDPNGFRSVAWRYTIPEDADDLNYSVRVDVAGDNCIRSGGSGFRVRTPLVIVPGMMGSYLYDQNNGGEVWLNLPGVLKDEVLVKGMLLAFKYGGLSVKEIIEEIALDLIMNVADPIIQAKIDQLINGVVDFCYFLNNSSNDPSCNALRDVLEDAYIRELLSAAMTDALADHFANNVLFLINDQHFKKLRLDSNGQPTPEFPLNVGGPITSILWPISDIFKSLEASLFQKGYLKDQDFFYHTYDWRMNIEYQSLKLSDKVNVILDQEGSKHVNIIAHSMGGLIAEHFIKYRATPSTVKSLVTLGTPHLGAPKVLKGLLCGEVGNPLDYFLEDWRVHAAVLNMSSAYQLSPSRAYFTKYPEGIFRDYSGATPFVSDSYDETWDYFQGKNLEVVSPFLMSMLSGLGESYTPQINFPLLQLADQFHANLDEQWNGSDYGVNSYNVVGCGIKTTSQLILTGEGMQEGFTAGDGTVPSLSAADVGALRTYAVPGGSHGSLPGYRTVDRLISDILKGVPEDRYDDISGQSPVVPYDEVQCQIGDGVFISIEFISQIASQLISPHSPYSYCNGSEKNPPVRWPTPDPPPIVDPYCLLNPWDCVQPPDFWICNPFTEQCDGPERQGGGISLEIPGSDYSVTQDGVSVYIPGPGALEIRFNGVDPGYVNLKFQLMRQGGINRTVIFYQVPVTPTTQGMLEWSQDAQDYILYLDQDGDGIYETQVAPLSQLNSDGSLDHVPPVTTATLNGIMGENDWYTSPVSLTLNAEDNTNGSGVAFSQYATAGALQYSKYTGPLAFNTSGYHDLHYRSIDMAANAEAAKTISYKIDTTPPQRPAVQDAGRYSFMTDQITAAWDSADPESGLAAAECSIGNAAGLSDITAWSPCAINTSVQISGLSLLYNHSYFINVRTKNAAGLWSEIGSSDGIKTLDPLADSDGDGVINRDEVTAKSDPFDLNSYPGAGVIHLLKGFNMINLQGDLVEAFDSDTPTAYQVLGLLGTPSEIDRIQKIDRATGMIREARYSGGNLNGDDFQVVPGEGLIVYARLEKTVPVTSVVCPAWNLRAGANLVGTPCASGLTAFQLLQGLGGDTKVSSIQRFNPSTGRFDTVAQENSHPVGVDFPIVPGEGYFIHMKQE